MLRIGLPEYLISTSLPEGSSSKNIPTGVPQGSLIGSSPIILLSIIFPLSIGGEIALYTDTHPLKRPPL
jgi:hypothetical protein